VGESSIVRARARACPCSRPEEPEENLGNSWISPCTTSSRDRSSRSAPAGSARPPRIPLRVVEHDEAAHRGAHHQQLHVVAGPGGGSVALYWEIAPLTTTRAPRASRARTASRISPPTLSKNTSTRRGRARAAARARRRLVVDRPSNRARRPAPALLRAAAIPTARQPWIRAIWPTMLPTDRPRPRRRPSVGLGRRCRAGRSRRDPLNPACRGGPAAGRARCPPA